MKDAFPQPGVEDRQHSECPVTPQMFWTHLFLDDPLVSPRYLPGLYILGPQPFSIKC